jgi:hypothetical protein
MSDSCVRSGKPINSRCEWSGGPCSGLDRKGGVLPSNSTILCVAEPWRSCVACAGPRRARLSHRLKNSGVLFREITERALRRPSLRAGSY